HANHAGRQGRGAADAAGQRALAVDGVAIQRLHQIADTDVRTPFLDIAVPVHVDGTGLRWGTVRIGLSLQPLLVTLVTTRLVLSALGIAAVAVVLLAGRFFMRKVTVPLQNLARATSIVATGDLDHAVEENLVGELGELARCFNKMTADLKHTQGAIQYQNQHLEHMVEMRTAALHQKALDLELANAELKELDRLKSDFLSNVSHELRTPLTSIRSFTEIMLDQPSELSEAERKDFLGIIASQAERLTRLISDLLDLSRIEAG